MSSIIKNATHSALKHILYRHACKQNMTHITHATNKHVYFVCKLHLIVTILKTQWKVIMVWMCLKYSSQRKWRIAPRQITLLHDGYLLIITVAITYNNFPLVIKLIHSVCVLLFFTLSIWYRRKWKFGLVVWGTGETQKILVLLSASLQENCYGTAYKIWFCIYVEESVPFLLQKPVFYTATK